MQNKMRMMMGLPPKEPTLLEEIDDTFTCSYRTRLIGFVTCFIFGLILTVMSFFFIASIVLNPSRFALLYSFGNLIALSGSFFLVGPMRQLKMVFKKKAEKNLIKIFFPSFHFYIKCIYFEYLVSVL